MKINLLGADVPLTKTYTEIAPGKYKEESYPHALRFTSFERTVESLRAFHDTLCAGAGEGLCLLKGKLARPIRNESRAGLTTATTATEWLCLDVDFPVTDRGPGEFLDALSESFAGVSFIFQYSSGFKIKEHNGWRGHFFVLLDKPQSPLVLKQWLIHLNHNVSSLSEKIALSASGGALCYPLDITTCQNDKLIYITPPICRGFRDPVDERFLFFERDREQARLDFTKISAARNEANKNRKIKELRKKASLPPRSTKTVQHGSIEIETNPDPVTITGIQQARGFTYLNLNGGDSWGYYFPDDKPEILYNFKGEPALYLKDVDSELYTERTRQEPVNINGAIPFGFLWPDNDSYYRGFANPDTKELAWLQPVGSKQKLRDFYVQNGVQPGKGWAVDEWRIVFDPSTKGYADFGKQEVNTYKATDYILNARPIETQIPPTIDRVLSSICVEQNVKKHFIKWLAFIFQTRKKTGTAWLFQGVPGTGKGVMFSYILSPLIGKSYCHEMTMDRLDDDFNAYLAENICLFLDEANISDSRNGDRLFNRLKNLITEPVQHIRGMRANAIPRNNFSNIILASNYDEIIPLTETDRRFNVAPRQEMPISLTHEDIDCISKELPAFANFLSSVSVSETEVTKIILTEARDRLVDVSRTTIDDFFLAVRDGDLSYFTSYLDQSIKSDVEGVRYHDYALAVKRWVDSVGTECHIPRNELRSCYQYLQNTTISATKFNRICRKYDIQSVPIRIGGQVFRGIHRHRWHLAEEEVAALREQEESNVVSIAKAPSKPST